MQRRAPRIMTKEFLPGLIGTHRLTHDMSIPRKGKPCCIYRRATQMSPHQDAKGMGRSEADGTQGEDSMASSIDAGDLVCPQEAACQAKMASHARPKGMTPA